MRLFRIRCCSPWRWVFEANRDRAIDLFVNHYRPGRDDLRTMQIIEYPIEPGLLPSESNATEDSPVKDCYLLGG